MGPRASAPMPRRILAGTGGWKPSEAEEEADEDDDDDDEDDDDEEEEESWDNSEVMRRVGGFKEG